MLVVVCVFLHYHWLLSFFIFHLPISLVSNIENSFKYVLKESIWPHFLDGFNLYLNKYPIFINEFLKGSKKISNPTF